MAARERTPLNRARGETSITINGREVKLLFTMAALAEIEDGLDCDGIAAISEKLESGSTRSLGVVISALARAAGDKVSVEEVRNSSLGFRDVVEAISAAFTAGAQLETASKGSATGKNH